MRALSSRSLAIVILSANLLFFSCDDDDAEFVIVFGDVFVEVTGHPGVQVLVTVGDDDDSVILAEDVPWQAEFFDQEQFFQAVVSKQGAGTEEVCVTVSSGPESKSACTSAPFGNASVVLVF